MFFSEIVLRLAAEPRTHSKVSRNFYLTLLNACFVIMSPLFILYTIPSLTERPKSRGRKLSNTILDPRSPNTILESKDSSVVFVHSSNIIESESSRISDLEEE